MNFTESREKLLQRIHSATADKQDPFSQSAQKSHIRRDLPLQQQINKNCLRKHRATANKQDPLLQTSQKSEKHKERFSQFCPKFMGGQRALLTVCPKFNCGGQGKLLAATCTTDNIPSAQNPKAGSKCFLQLDQNSTAGSERTISQAPKIRGRAANGFLNQPARQSTCPSAQNLRRAAKASCSLPKIQQRAAKAFRSHLHNGQYSKRPKSKGGQQMLLAA
jgi:hypothetical protein